MERMKWPNDLMETEARYEVATSPTSRRGNNRAPTLASKPGRTTLRISTRNRGPVKRASTRARMSPLDQRQAKCADIPAAKRARLWAGNAEPRTAGRRRQSARERSRKQVNGSLKG